MELQINGRREELEQASLTVSELLKARDVPDPEMVSVQLNGEILEQEEYAKASLSSGDVLEFLYFMGGGSPAESG